MELSVYSAKGKETGRKASLVDSIYGVEPNDHAIYLDVKLIQANKRQGTHKAKERAEIAGSTRKIKKQKGTGTARAGSIKNPLFKGGGRVFGPRPRNYGFKLNKKVRKLARKSALAYKAKEDSIVVLEDLKMDTPRTKDYIAVLNSLKLNETKLLIVTNDGDTNVHLAARNVPNSKVIPASQINTYDLLNCKKLVIAEGAIETIEKLFN